MTQHKQLSLALAMKQIVPFSELSLKLLFAVAGISVLRQYIDGETILAADTVPDEVHIPVAGLALCDGGVVEHAFDIPAVAFDRRLQRAYRAGPAGCRTALITKSHVFTLLRECPELSVKLAGMPNCGSAAC